METPSKCIKNVRTSAFYSILELNAKHFSLLLWYNRSMIIILRQRNKQLLRKQ